MNNEASIAPVISQGGRIIASSNFGPKTAAAGGCEFIADFEINDGVSASAGAAAISVACIDFDGESCFEDEPSEETSVPPDGQGDEGKGKSSSVEKSPKAVSVSILLLTLATLTLG